MDNWKLQLIVVLCGLVQACQGLSFNINKEKWLSKDWQDDSLEARLDSWTANRKRSKVPHFYGLMGKRSGTGQPTTNNIQMGRRRNKGEMFVGLMGRSITSGESLTRIIPVATSSALDVSQESDKQDSQQEEWAQLSYY